MKKPNLFLVGAPKCGTTSYHDYLRQHPDIFMCEPKEPYFFGAGEVSAPRPLDDYLALFEPWANERWGGESTTHYLFSEKAPGEIAEFAPEARILIMLRNPVDMIYSYYYELIHCGYPYPAGLIQDRGARVLGFDEAIAGEDDRARAFRDDPTIPVKLRSHLFHTEVADYAPQVRRYLDQFGRDRVQVIIYDDFVSNLDMVYRDTLRFLGVDDRFRPNPEIHNAGRILKNPRLHLFLRDNPMMRSAKQIAGKVIPRPLGQRLMSRLYQMNYTRGERPPMAPRTEAALKERYRPGVEQLSHLLDRDLVALWGLGS